MPDIDYVSSKPLPENLSDIADSLRSKTGISGEIHTDEMAGIIDTLGSPLPSLTNPATAADVLDGKEVILPDANDEPIVVTGTAPYNFTSLATGAMTDLWKGATGFQSTEINLDVPYVTELTGVFQNVFFADGTKITINAPSATKMSRMFCYSDGTSVPSTGALNKIKIITAPERNITFGNCFYRNKYVEEIDYTFDFYRATNYQPYYNIIYSARALKEIRFAPYSIQYIPDTYSFQQTLVLSDDSLISLANALWDNTSGTTKTLRLNKPAGEGTYQAQLDSIMGTVSQSSRTLYPNEANEQIVTFNFFTKDTSGTVSLTDFITTYKNWGLSL